ncbi:MAG: AAA family ATPase [Nanoarchaeota archaeon]
MKNKTIGIISIKGGVGKTSAVGALGASLANDYGKKVLLVDANFSAPNLGLQLGIYNPEVTLHHLLDDKSDLKGAIQETGYGFDVIPGAQIYKKLNPFKLGEKLREAKKKYDIILIDSSPNMNEEILATMIASDELLVVTTPDHVTLSSTLHAIKLAKEKRTPITGIILNKVYNKKFEVRIEDIEALTGVNVLAVLPHELSVLQALSNSMPSTMNKYSDTTKEYRKLAACLIGEKYSEGKLSKIKEMFSRWAGGVPKQEINRTLFVDKARTNPFYRQ